MTRSVRRILGTWRMAVAMVIVATGTLLIVATLLSMRPVPQLSSFAAAEAKEWQLLDRQGRPLAMTFQNIWNLSDQASLHHIPDFLQQAVVMAEDKRFFRHHGMDWKARLHALVQNIAAGRTVRGASTITEQVVRMLHPRPRTLWTRWLEGWEALALERRATKADILEFYLNQVPYAANRRGVVQAARYTFDRDLDTLSRKEMLALAVLIRAPGRLDPHRGATSLERRACDLLHGMAEAGTIPADDVPQIAGQPIVAHYSPDPPLAVHFARYALEQAHEFDTRNAGIRTTLDSGLQRTVQKLLDRRIEQLGTRNVDNGAVLIVDHMSGEVLSWCVASPPDGPNHGSAFDAVRTPRQPGSTLKPFLYALALEQGWTAATAISDTPMSESVGRGLHTYHNYSRVHYGDITLRQALGNSLNIPALKTIRFVGPERFLSRLRDLGLSSLSEHPNVYGDGLALGNGEVTLLELVRAYVSLARGGWYGPLTVLADMPPHEPGHRAFSAESATLIGNILSDPEARRLEFGNGGLLRLPVQTAVKTGTSNDFRDSWAVGYNYRYTVGIWFGNMDGTATDGVTGASGPALLLRSVFAELVRHQKTRPLSLSPRLVQRSICSGPESHGAECTGRTEWFLPGTAVQLPAPRAAPGMPQLVQPTPGLELALDPRIPKDQEYFAFKLSDEFRIRRVRWIVDGIAVGESTGPSWLWPLSRGKHHVRAMVDVAGESAPMATGNVFFLVK